MYLLFNWPGLRLPVFWSNIKIYFISWSWIQLVLNVNFEKSFWRKILHSLHLTRQYNWRMQFMNFHVKIVPNWLRTVWKNTVPFSQGLRFFSSEKVLVHNDQLLIWLISVAESRLLEAQVFDVTLITSVYMWYLQHCKKNSVNLGTLRDKLLWFRKLKGQDPRL